MKSFFDEEVLLDSTFSAHPRIYVYGNYFKGRHVFKCIFNKKRAKQWINSSGKGDPPPDFYNDKKHIMLEVMKVDDHSHKNRKGKWINPTAANERKILKELQLRFGDSTSDDAIAFISAPTGLPTNEDHRFSWYKCNFKRVIEEHARKIKLYKDNHPGYSVVFFVYDESSAYILPKNSEDIHNSHKIGERIDAFLHYWYKDIDFVKIIKNSGADYLIWYAPCKRIDVGHGSLLSFSCAAVYDIKNLSLDDRHFEKYFDSFLISAET